MEIAEVVLAEGNILSTHDRANLGGLDLIRRNVVEYDGGLEHQQHIDAMLAEILGHSGNLLTVDPLRPIAPSTRSCESATQRFSTRSESRTYRAGKMPRLRRRS